MMPPASFLLLILSFALSFILQADSSSLAFTGFQFTFFNSTDGTCTGNSTSQLVVQDFGCNPFSSDTIQYFLGNGTLDSGSFYCSSGASSNFQVGICTESMNCSVGCFESEVICLKQESNSTFNGTTTFSTFDFSIICNEFTRTTQPSFLPTSAPTNLGPTTSPTISSPSIAPTSSAPTLSPTFSPISSFPTQSPTSSVPTNSPSTSPTHSPTFHPTLAPTREPTTLAPISAPPFCFHPASEIGYFPCKNRIALCGTWGILLKYIVGDRCSPLGSSFPENEQLFGGSCQCLDFCAYSCESSCNLDPQCYWFNGACYQAISDLPGMLTVSKTCTQTVAPTKSPTLSMPTNSPSTSMPSLSPTTSPTIAPTPDPTNKPAAVSYCDFGGGETCYDIPTCPQGGDNCYCFHVPGQPSSGPSSGICGQQYACETLVDCTSNADCQAQENCLQTCCSTNAKCVPQVCGNSGIGRLLFKDKKFISEPCKETTISRCD